MGVKWTSKSLEDLVRLHAFLQPVNSQAAKAVVSKLTTGAKRLEQHPRIGSPLPEFAPRDVRRLIIGDYEMRYELVDDVVFILRLWHAREYR